jgi:hypothetical protein
MAYQARDLNTYIPKYADLKSLSDQEVYDFSIDPYTNSADQANATGELRRRSLFANAPKPLPTFDGIPQVAVPYGAGPGGGGNPFNEQINRTVPQMPWSRERTITAGNAAMRSAYLGSATSDFASSFAAPTPPSAVSAYRSRKATSARQLAENLVGGVLQRFGVPRRRLAGRGLGLYNAYSSW